MSNITLSLANNWFMGALTSIGTILLAIVVLLLMITIHEYGHYIFGKLLHFKINEFAVGFGKAIYSKTKKNGEKFSLRIIPLGGYCAFEGEDADSENPNAFNNQAPWKRLIVLFGGVFFNFVSAIIFSVVLLAVIGNGTQQIYAVEGPNAAVTQTTGLQAGDIVLEVNGQHVGFLNGGLPGLTSSYNENEQIPLLIERNGEELNVTIHKYEVTEIDTVTGEEVTYLRMGVTLTYVPLSLGQSLLQATPFSFQVAGDFLQILGKLFTGQMGLEQIGGPITTIEVIANASAQSLLNLLLLIPLIAINLAVFNLLPIPALDGARMVFVVIEWIRKKPINRDLEAKIHMIGLLILFSLVILVDVLHLLLY